MLVGGRRAAAAMQRLCAVAVLGEEAGSGYLAAAGSPAEAERSGTSQCPRSRLHRHGHGPKKATLLCVTASACTRDVTNTRIWGSSQLMNSIFQLRCARQSPGKSCRHRWYIVISLIRTTHLVTPRRWGTARRPQAAASPEGMCPVGMW